MQERTAGRRATDKELSHLRTLELIIRNFIAHFDDQMEERFAPRTREMVKESKAVCADIDDIRRSRAAGVKPPA